MSEPGQAGPDHPLDDPLSPYDAVLVLSYGGPGGPQDVLPFMRNATAGRGVPDSRLLEVSGHYQRFGGISPINARNAELVEALRAELAARGSRLPVVVGNRNWHPFVSQALRALAEGGARRVLALTTAAFGSYSGCRQYREDVAAALDMLEAGTDGATGDGPEADAAARVGGPGGAPVRLVVDKARPYYNTPGVLAANVDAIVSACAELAGLGVPAAGVRLVLVTHSVPVSMEAGSAPRPGSLAGGPGHAGHGAVRGVQPGSLAGGPGGQGRPPVVPAAEVADSSGLGPGGAGPAGAEDSAGEVGSAEAVGLARAAGPASGGLVLEPGMTADLSSEVSYVAQHEALARVLVPEVAARLGLAQVPYDLVYCSRSGPPQARWLEPDVNDHLVRLAEGSGEGAGGERPQGVVVAPIGFVSDHMEVVFDLDTEARQTARSLGIPYVRAATAGTHPAFVASLADVLLERAATARGEEVHPVSTTGVGPFHTVCPPGCCLPGARPAGV